MLVGSHVTTEQARRLRHYQHPVVRTATKEGNGRGGRQERAWEWGQQKTNKWLRKKDGREGEKQKSWEKGKEREKIKKRDLGQKKQSGRAGWKEVNGKAGGKREKEGRSTDRSCRRSEQYDVHLRCVGLDSTKRWKCDYYCLGRSPYSSCKQAVSAILSRPAIWINRQWLAMSGVFP